MQHYAKDKRIILKDSISIGSSVFKLIDLPEPLVIHEKLGIAADRRLSVSRIYLDQFTCHPRSIITPKGDFILFYPAGPIHYAWHHSSVADRNNMYIRRSGDHGRTWSPPEIAWSIPYSQHAAIPFIPRDSNRIYVFGTEPDPDHGYTNEENSPIAFRFSDDDGHSWSKPRFINPVNAPGFMGMSAMRMTETSDGTWLLGTHDAVMINGKYHECRQYLLVSRDSGETWTLEPSHQDGSLGWGISGGRLHEGRPCYLGNNEVFMLIRSSEGHLWSVRSYDNGRTWTTPEPTGLKHLEAPPMLFKLDQTLVAFIHNRSHFANAFHEFAHEIRAELWMVMSNDGGRTWSEPRFVMAEAGFPPILNQWGGQTPMVSYADLLVDGDNLHLFVDHEMRQVLHAKFKLSDLTEFLPECFFNMKPLLSRPISTKV